MKSKSSSCVADANGRIVAIIPARGGSKGIPNKNLTDFAGKPLVAWSILQALEAPSVSSVVVSSDSDEILDVAKSYGAMVVKRPPELSSDTASSEVALIHALELVEEELGKVKSVVFLQATSPLREPGDIEGAINKFEEECLDSLFSQAVLEGFCAWTEENGILKGKTYDPDNRGRRQDSPPLFLETGSIYVFRPETLRLRNNRLGGKIGRFTMESWKSFEIDNYDDLEICEILFRKHLLSRWLNHGSQETRLGFIPQLIVYDFDGVMTDNRVSVTEDGLESVEVNRSDGLAVQVFRTHGIRQLILSTETNKVVESRASKLQIDFIQGSNDKLHDLIVFCNQNRIRFEEILYVGNDVNDLDVMREVGFPVAPADAHPQVLRVARYVTKAAGGAGVIRELSDWLLGN
jgi:YrbI family 3-deoxy-D-manno-octulosonate 8-phosphate phosphatase